MNTTTQIANRFREVILNGTWIANTNIKHQVSDLTWEQATQKVASLNTIAMLVFHLHYYVAGVSRFFEGKPLDISDKYSFDLPPIQTQEAWEKLQNQLWTDAERFALLVEKMSEEQLEEIFIHEKYGNYRRNIEGMTEHCYYHLGQIVLIKKMILKDS